MLTLTGILTGTLSAFGTGLAHSSNKRTMTNGCCSNMTSSCHARPKKLCKVARKSKNPHIFSLGSIRYRQPHMRMVSPHTFVYLTVGRKCSGATVRDVQKVFWNLLGWSLQQIPVASISDYSHVQEGTRSLAKLFSVDKSVSSGKFAWSWIIWLFWSEQSNTVMKFCTSRTSMYCYCFATPAV